MKLPLAALALVLVQGSALAEEARVHFSVGYDDLFQRRSPSLGFGAEYASQGFGPGGKFSWNVAGMATVDLDLWAGAGIAWTHGFDTSPWFVEVSFLPGVFYRDSEPAGRSKWHFPMFRTQGAVGYEFGDGSTVSLALSHHSAAKLEEAAGSTETIWLRYGRSF